MRSVEGGRAPREQLAKKERGLLPGKRRIEEVQHQLGEELEASRAVLGTLEVGPIAEEDGLEAVDEQVDVAKGVEVLCQGLGERRPHAVEPSTACTRGR